MKPLKAPGIDGLHAQFFQSQWLVVGASFLSLIQGLWSGNNLDPLLNRTLLALIPKSSRPYNMSEFRPISLCSVVYKTTTKVIANRIRTVLPTLIALYQTSFIQGRNIVDNIIIAQEVMHSMRKKQGNNGWMAIKVDLEKAFDRLRWDFVEDTLQDVGLPTAMSRLIMNCITTPTMQVLWNGKPSESFTPQRGIRQGDPLSPYIFVLCMERLSQAIQAAVGNGEWKPIKMGRRGVPLTHLFFADDLIIFGHTSDCQVAVIMRILQEFCCSSGHKVSHSKTKIYFSKNVKPATRRSICRKLGYQQTDSLGKYLGVPLITGRVSSSTYNYILDRIQSKLSGWKSRSLSLAGRITLAKSVLSSVPFYVMQSTLLPQACLKSVEKIIRKFIWGYTDDHRGISLLRWSELCQPLENGGGGLLRLEAQNKAFLSKLIYKMHSQPHNLWVQVLKGKYTFQKSSTDVSKLNSSHFWKNIAKVWQDTTLNIKWNPGDGRDVRFWTDYWVGDYGPLKNISYSYVTESEASEPILKFIDDNGVWQWDLFQHLLPPTVLHAIQATSIELAGTEPSCSWNLTSSGQFTTKSAYHASESLNWNNVEEIWVRLWKLPMAQRVKTFTWLLLKGRLLTNAERHRRGMTQDQNCTLCQGGIENINHVIKDCPLASSVWRKILPTDMSLDFFGRDFIQWLSQILKSPKADTSWKVGLCIIAWKLWEARNHRLFRQETYTTTGIITQVVSIANHTRKSFSLVRSVL